jgi:hypothetical protein
MSFIDKDSFMIGICDLYNMDDKQIRTLEQVKHFVENCRRIEFNGLNIKEKYRWMEEVRR